MARVAVTVAGLAVGAGAVAPMTASAARPTTIAAGVSTTATPTPVGPVITTAQTQLNRALTYLANGRYTAAITALSRLRDDIVQVHEVGMDPMNPARALAVFQFDHQLVMGLLPPFNGLRRLNVVNALQATLTLTFANRTKLLDAIIALPAEGAGGNYDDNMADILPSFNAEVKAYTAALSQYRLVAAAKTALTNDLAAVTATKVKFARRFGGGE